MEISNRDLWLVVTGASSLQDLDQIDEELTQSKDRLFMGLSWYKKPSQQSAQKLQQSKDVKPKRKEIVQRVSSFLDLDEWQSFELFSSYLENDFRGSKKQLLNILKSGNLTEGLLLKIMDYYFEERLHILRCLKYMLCYWQDPCHVFREQFAAFIESIQEHDKLIKKIMDQYKACCSSSVAFTEASASSLSKAKNSKWTLQYLREQSLLLEIMVLYYREFLNPPKSFLETVKLFQSQGFGTRQANRHNFDARAEALIPVISSLQVLILIESLYLENLNNLMEGDSYNSHHLMKDRDTLKVLDALFMNWGELPQHGPVMLAWAVFRFVTMEQEQGEDIRRIGTRALRCNVFQFLYALLSSEAFSASSPVANTARSLIYTLVVTVLTFFQEDTLGDIQLLVSVLSLTLREKGLCVQFWNSDLNEGAGLLLNLTKKWFPFHFLPLLELLKSLAGEQESAGKVFDYLDSMSSYTEVWDNRVGDVDCTGDDKMWKVVHPKVLYRSAASDGEKLRIPRGTPGELLTVSEGPSAIRWQYHYSAWKLFVFEIDAFLQAVSSGKALNGINIIAVVDLVNEILKNDWSKAAQLEPIIRRLYVIVQRCTPSPNIPQTLIAACLSCLATIASHNPLQVWLNLQQTGILPCCVSFKTNQEDRRTVQSLNIASGYFGAILSTKERPMGHYPVTIAMLKLFLQLFHGIGHAQEGAEQPVNFLDLAACLLFIVQEVFTGFHNWRFVGPQEREEIGQKSLEIFNTVLGLHFKQPAEDLVEEEFSGETAMDCVDRSRSAVVQEILIQGLLYSEAGQSLLNILGTGVDAVDKLISQGGVTGNQASALLQLIKLSFSVLNRLLARKRKDDNISPLEQALSTQVIHQIRDTSSIYGSNLGQSHLITVIASYIHHRLDSRLPTLAALLLKRLCLVAPMSMYASFGADAVPLRNAFVSRLQAMTEDVRLKVAILEFIATAVETQPGLIELFLDLSCKDDQEFVIGQNSCLHAVLEIIDPTKQANAGHPVQLLAAAYNLLHSLWHDRRDAALNAIRTSPHFWQNLTRPLLEGPSLCENEDFGFHLEMCSCGFKIVALEAYYVCRGQLDGTLKAVMKEFASRECYHYWSRFLINSDQRWATECDELWNSQDCSEEMVKFFRSWKTFLVVASSVEVEVFGLCEGKRRNQILSDILEALKYQVSRPASVEAMTIAYEMSSLYLVLLKKWKSCVRSENSVFTDLVDVLETSQKNDSQLLAHIEVPVFSAISVLLQHARAEGKSDTLDSSYAMALLPMACDPLEYLNGKFMEQRSNGRDRVLELSVFIIDEVLSILLANPGQWFPVLREHALFASLVQALEMCIKTRKRLEFTEAVLHLLLSLSRIQTSAEALAANSLAQPLCLGMASLLGSLESEHHRQLLYQSSSGLQQTSAEEPSFPIQRNWSGVWQLGIAVMASMLRTLRHGFLKDALDFTGVHRERLAQAMDGVRQSQSFSVLSEAEEVTAFLLELAHFSSQWRFLLPDVLNHLQCRVGVLSQSCIALLTHPRLLAHFLETSRTSSAKHESVAALSDVTFSLSSSFSRGLLRTFSYADEEAFRSNPLVTKTQAQLLKILCNALAFLRQFTPDICEILIDEGMDIEEHAPILSVAFSSPAVDHEEPLCFGTLLACMNMCLTNLSPGDLRSPVKSPSRTLCESLPRSLLIFSLENSLLIALSQAARYLRDPGVDSREKQLLKRELGSELGNFLGGLFRHVRRSLPPSPASVQVSPMSASRRTSNKALAFTDTTDQRFFRLADTFVKQMLK